MKRKILICFLALMVFSTTTINLPGFRGVVNVKEAQASGIPVVDVAHIMQTLIKYLTQLMEYSEAISTTTANWQQYAQQMQDYYQKLKEYQSYLNQLESIRSQISNGDWNMLMRTIQDYYGRSKRSVVRTMDPQSNTYENDLNTALGHYGYVPEDPTTVENDARRLGMWSSEYEAVVKKDYDTFDLYKDRMRTVSDNAKKDREFLTKIDRHKQTLSSLGNESDLATLQALAAMNVTMMEQNRSTSQTMNQILMNQENAAAAEAAERAKTRRIEIDRLKNKQNVQVPSMTRFGRL